MGGGAREIYRLKSSPSINLSSANEALKSLNVNFSTNIDYIRNFGLFGSIAALFVAVPYVGWLAGLASFIMIFLAISKLSEISGDPRPRKDYIHMTIAFIVACICIYIAIPDEKDIARSFFSNDAAESLGVKIAIFAIIALIAILYGIFRQYKTFFGISRLTSQKLFLAYVGLQIVAISVFLYEYISFIVMISNKNFISNFSLPDDTLGYILLALSYIALIIAWIRIKEIKKI